MRAPVLLSIFLSACGSAASHDIAGGLGSAGAGSSSAGAGAATAGAGSSSAGAGAATAGAGSSSAGAGAGTAGAGPSSAGASSSGGSSGAASGSGGRSGSGAAGSGTAGSGSGSAGAAGAATLPPHVVGKCDGLAKVGQWEEITPSGMIKDPPYEGALMGLVDPNNSGTVYVTTSANGIFKSTDCGSSWKKINTGRNGSQLDQGKIWSAVLDPAAPNTLYVITGYGPAGLWKSTNGGVDWDDILPKGQGMPGFVARVSMDPTNHLHLLINFHDNCTGGHTPVCFGETTDGGKTWAVKDFPTSLQKEWGEGTFLMPLDEKRWLFEYWDLYFTGDAGKTWKKVDTGGAAAIQGPYFKAPDGSYWLTSALGVLTSKDGEHWSTIPNSFGNMDAIVGCGNRLFSVVGFQPPDGNEFVYSATYSAPTKWSALDTPGLPKPMKSGANSVVCDNDHNIVYTAAQAGGFWRMVTDAPVKAN